MKIAMVTEYLAPKGKPYFGGVDARTINLATNLAKHNEVHIITTFMEGTERIENYDDVKIHRVGRKRKFTQRGDFLQRIKFNSAVASEILKLQPEVVDASGFVSYAGSYKGAKKIDVPAVVTVHEVWQGEWVQNMGLINGLAGHFLEKHYLKYPFDEYIAVSKFTKEKLIEKMRIAEEKIAVVYNGIDLDLYESTTVDEKYANPTIVTVCRLVAYKRVDDLIRALKILKLDFPEIQLKIIGTGPKENYLRILSSDLGLEDNVDFLGKIANTREMIKILKRSHVFALPSIAEGFGMVIIEAMACGLPYVASDIPPIREVTNGGIGGKLYEPKDYEDLAVNIKTQLTENTSRTKMMKDINRYIEKYDWRHVAYVAEERYNKLLKTSFNGGHM